MMNLLWTSMSKMGWHKIKLEGYVRPNNMGLWPKQKPRRQKQNQNNLSMLYLHIRNGSEKSAYAGSDCPLT